MKELRRHGCCICALGPGRVVPTRGSLVKFDFSAAILGFALVGEWVAGGLWTPPFVLIAEA